MALYTRWVDPNPNTTDDPVALIVFVLAVVIVAAVAVAVLRGR